MKKIINLFSVLFALFATTVLSAPAILYNTVFGVLIAAIIGVNPLITVVALNLISVRFGKPVKSNLLFMSIQKEIWADTFIKLFWKSNLFAKQAVQAAQEHIYGGKIVHIPKVNTAPGITRNRTSFPATVTTRTDVDVLYLIDEFFIDPFRIPNAEKYELSFDKRASVIQDQANAANQTAADWLAYQWCKYTQTEISGSTTMLAQKIRTTGGAVASHLSGTTGNRKLLKVADLRAAKVLMNAANVPTEDRYALIDSDMMDQLSQDPEFKALTKASEEEVINGATAKIQGFNLYERSSVVRYDNAGTPLILLPTTANDTDTNGGVILWQKQGVETAMGTTEVFKTEDDPTYYGDIYSGILRMGGRLRRTDSVINIIQAASA